MDSNQVLNDIGLLGIRRYCARPNEVCRNSQTDRAAPSKHIEESDVTPERRLRSSLKLTHPQNNGENDVYI